MKSRLVLFRAKNAIRCHRIRANFREVALKAEIFASYARIAGDGDDVNIPSLQNPLARITSELDRAILAVSNAVGHPK